MHKVNEKGVKSLKAVTRHGRPLGLTPEVIHAVRQQLEKSPLDFGLKRLRWYVPSLVVHLKRQLGVKLKVRQAQNSMHRAGYRLKRPSYSYLAAKVEGAKKVPRALKKTSVSEDKGDICFRG